MVLFFDNIDPFIFLISFGIGMLLVYIFQSEPIIVYKYPTPYNAGKIMYKDDAGTCYKYKVEQVKCNNNPTKFNLQS